MRFMKMHRRSDEGLAHCYILLHLFSSGELVQDVFKCGSRRLSSLSYIREIYHLPTDWRFPWMSDWLIRGFHTSVQYCFGEFYLTGHQYHIASYDRQNAHPPPTTKPTGFHPLELSRTLLNGCIIKSVSPPQSYLSQHGGRWWPGTYLHQSWWHSRCISGVSKAMTTICDVLDCCTLLLARHLAKVLC